MGRVELDGRRREAGLGGGQDWLWPPLLDPNFCVRPCGLTWRFTSLCPQNSWRRYEEAHCKASTLIRGRGQMSPFPKRRLLQLPLDALVTIVALLLLQSLAAKDLAAHQSLTPLLTHYLFVQTPVLMHISLPISNWGKMHRLFFQGAHILRSRLWLLLYMASWLVI